MGMGAPFAPTSPQYHSVLQGETSRSVHLCEGAHKSACCCSNSSPFVQELSSAGYKTIAVAAGIEGEGAQCGQIGSERLEKLGR